MSDHDLGGSSGCVGAVRGAVAVAANTAAAIQDGTARLLQALMEANRIRPERIVSAIFTATEDLNADFPAHAARQLGWTDVPLLGAREIAVPGAMPRVIRVLLTVSGVPPGARLVPVYLDGAAGLRPDLTRAVGSGPVERAAGAAGDEVNDFEAPHAAMPAAAAPPTPIALIGLGQIGGSIGLGLAKNPAWRRIGFDLDPAAAAAALARGAIDESASSLESACAVADIAVLAIPVDALPAAIEHASRALPTGAALVDTGSARAGVTATLQAAEARGVRAVGLHPIAGREGSGLEAADARLFTGATFALMPVAEPVPEVVSRLIRDLGARATRIAPAEHDRALARTSHLPYLVACALRSIGETAVRGGWSGPGFRDMTRLAASDPRMAGAYCRANASEVSAAWHELRDAIESRIAELR